MSFGADVDVYGTCDGCGASIHEGDPTFCSKCGVVQPQRNTSGKCNWLWGRNDGEYICGYTREEWKWEGQLPPFCPMCGRELQ